MPISFVFQTIVAFRNWAYDRGIFRAFRASVPVICVGNVTTGGSGKTPFVIYLCELLKQNNFEPVILTRGYGGKESGPYEVTANSTAQDVGDEAVLQWRSFNGGVPIVVARKRAAGARFIEKQALGNVIVMDDGYQHRALFRDVNILLLGVVKNKFLLPAGDLREPLGQALSRADVVIRMLDESSSDSTNCVEIGREGGDALECVAQIIPQDAIILETREALSIQTLKGLKGVVVTAIANPQRFLATLRHLGIDFRSVYRFRDHHHFSEDEVGNCTKDEIEKIFVTEKDAVKLEAFPDIARRAVVVRVKVNFVSGLKDFCALLSQRLRRSIVSTPDTPSRARVMCSS